jgi:hypothetical protein
MSIISGAGSLIRNVGQAIPNRAVIAFGYILFVIGLLIGLLGDVRFLVVVYRHGLGWFFGCLFVPVLGWLFFLLHARETWRPLALSMTGLVVAGVGYHIGGFDFLS